MAERTDLFACVAFFACLSSLGIPVNGIVYLVACPPVGSKTDKINNHIIHIGSRSEAARIRITVPADKETFLETRKYELSMEPYEMTMYKVERIKIKAGDYLPIVIETDNFVDITAVSQTSTSSSSVYNVYPIAHDTNEYIMTVPSRHGMYAFGGRDMEFTGGYLNASHGIVVVCGRDTTIGTITPLTNWYTESVGVMCPFLDGAIKSNSDWLNVFVSENFTDLQYIDTHGMQKTVSVDKKNRYFSTSCTKAVAFVLKADSPICAIVSFHADHYPFGASFTPLVGLDEWLTSYMLRSFEGFNQCGMIFFIEKGKSDSVLLNGQPLTGVICNTINNHHSESKVWSPVTGSDMYIMRVTSDTCDKRGKLSLLQSLDSDVSSIYSVYMIGEGANRSYYIPGGSALTLTYDKQDDVPIFPAQDPPLSKPTAAGIKTVKPTEAATSTTAPCNPLFDAKCNVTSGVNGSDFHWRICDDAPCSGPVLSEYEPILSSLLMASWQTTLVVLVGIPAVLGLGVAILFYYRYKRYKRKQKQLSQNIGPEHPEDDQLSQSTSKSSAKGSKGTRSSGSQASGRLSGASSVASKV